MRCTLDGIPTWREWASIYAEDAAAQKRLRSRFVNMLADTMVKRDIKPANGPRHLVITRCAPDGQLPKVALEQICEPLIAAAVLAKLVRGRKVGDGHITLQQGPVTHAGGWFDVWVDDLPF